MSDMAVTNILKNDISRRKFLSACAVCAAGAALLPGCRKTGTKIPPLYTVSDVKTRIKLIFAYPDPDYPNWPNIGYDFKGYSDRLLGSFRERCPDVDFSTVSTMNGSAEEGQRILQEEQAEIKHNALILGLTESKIISLQSTQSGMTDLTGMLDFKARMEIVSTGAT